MALPPPHDPLRPLLSSARSARGIGILQICLALVVMICVFVTSNSRDTLFVSLGVCCILLCLPGIFSMILSHYIERSRRWALIAMIALTSLEMLVIAPLFLRGFLFVDVVSMGIGGVFMAAFVILIVQLARSFSALRAHDVRFDRGFAPIMPAAPATTEGSDVNVSKT